jgi:ribosomal protein S18 acetylase RimI-like enzyme
MGKIISFKPELAHLFQDLNLEWLQQYFYVEPHDEELLSQCEEVIINQGGYIFFYEEDGEILGTFALIKISENEYELGKMAVDKKARGKGIGQQMMRFCIGFSQKQSWKRLILYSNTSLENSIYLYRKYGFKEIPIEKNNPYSRGNIKMEFIL